MTEEEYLFMQEKRQEIYEALDFEELYEYVDYGVFGKMVTKDTIQAVSVGYGTICEYHYEALYTNGQLAGYACQRIKEEYLIQLGGV